ncbi:peptidoglycan/xylan/chitin deacetylase (PgdA/CDA1 family) [Streptomyces sp. Ag109_G2-6]|uniref:polysaccharide deacetylase family protein n=1 Tax=Streptomyces TaxID=1883 RepID=UPI000FA3F4BE|nr:polysaccharide deacetylase family protein [Streptomyces sp. Ag109_G2-6]RPF43869.1 peptidoglycan/xylan/chitin deacetylase (PgdA/CDA1 family) [Streptomyces sp. Ag109_G2-6]
MTGLAAALLMGACGGAPPAPVPRAAEPAPRSPVGTTGPPVPARPAPVDCRRTACVALTFDAGPGPDTAKLLDVLREKDVHATFFLLGKNIEARPGLVRREAVEGHELGNHTWTHALLPSASPQGIRRELVLVQDRVRELTGRTPTLMRPPRGLTDARVAEVCRSLGLAEILWSVTAKDYRDHDPRVIADRVLQGAQRDGIILLHDVYPGTVPAVPAVIDGLRRRGLTPVTVSQLFAPRRPEPGRAYWNASEP